MALKDLLYQITFDINDSAIDSAERKTEGLEDSARGAMSSFERLNRQVNSMSESANKLGGTLQSAGADFAAPFLAGSAAMVAGLGSMVNTAADFESGMSRVGALSGSTTAELQTLTDEAERLGATTVFSATEASEGMQYLAMAGYDTSEIISAMPGLLDTAAAGQVGLGEAADITSNILSGFNLEAGETGRVADVLTAAFTSSNTDINMLGETMKYVAPIASQVGLSLEEMSAAAGLLGNAGIQGSEAGTALRMSLIRLADPPKEAQKVMDNLGISVTDSQGNFKSLADIVGEFNTATEGMTESQRLAAVSTVTGTEAASAFLTLMSSGSDTIKDYTSELENSGGAAQRVAQQQMDNLNGSIELMKSSFEGVAISIGNALIPGIRAVVDAITSLFDWFNNLSDGTKTFIAYTLAAVAAIMTLIAIGGTLIIFLGSIAMSWAGFLTTLSVFGTFVSKLFTPFIWALNLVARGITLLLSPIGRLMAVFRTIGSVISMAVLQFRLFAPILARLVIARVAAAAMTALRVAITFLTGPIGIVITALTLLGVGLVELYQHNETFRNGVNSAWTAIQDAVAASIDYILTKFQQLTNWISGLSGSFSAIGEYIRGSFDGIGNTIATLAPLLSRVALGFLGISGPVGWVIALVITFASYIYKLIAGNEQLQSSLMGAWSSIMTAIQPVIGVIGQLASVALQTFIQILTPAAQEFARAWQELQPSFQETGQVIMQSLQQLQPVFQELMTAFAQFGPLFAQIGVQLVSSFGQIAQVAIPMFAQAIQQILPLVIQIVTQLAQVFAQIGTSILPLLMQAFQMIFPLILQIVMAVLPIVIQLITSIIPIVLQIAQMVLPLLVQVVQMVFPIILAIIQAVMPIIIQIIQAIIPIIMMIISTVLPMLLNIFNMVFPLILTIVQMVVPIITMLLQMVAMIITTIVIPAIQIILTVVQAVFPVIVTIIQVAVNVITVVLQIVATIISSVVVPAIQFILSIVQAVFPAIQLIISTVINLIVGIINTAMDLLQGDWEGAWNTIKSTAETIWDNIVAFFEGLDLYQAGVDMLTGLIDGIKSMAGNVASAVGDVASDAWNGFKGFFKIGSPSKLMEQGGAWVMEGGTIGVESGASDFINAMQNTASLGYAGFNPMEGFSIAQAATNPNRPSAQAQSGGDSIHVEINVDMQGGSPEEAQAVSTSIRDEMEAFFGSLDRSMGDPQEL